MSDLKNVKHYISSPTEDGNEDTFSVSELNNASWPEFSDIKGVLDFKSDGISEERMIALLTYILKGSVSSINVTNINYLLKLFYENEVKLYSAYRDKRTLSDEIVKKMLAGRKYMHFELLKELGLQEENLKAYNP